MSQSFWESYLEIDMTSVSFCLALSFFAKVRITNSFLFFQFDEEERLAREQEHEDAILAQNLASQSHDMSESDEDVVEVNRNEEVPVRELVDLDSDVEDVEKEEESSLQMIGMCYCYLYR